MLSPYLRGCFYMKGELFSFCAYLQYCASSESRSTGHADYRQSVRQRAEKHAERDGGVPVGERIIYSRRLLASALSINVERPTNVVSQILVKIWFFQQGDCACPHDLDGELYAGIGGDGDYRKDNLVLV